jgi:drug/metabolite transporter (DMT)-like permease
MAVRAARGRAVAFALGTGAFIASYTLWDKYAVSTLGTPAVLQGYATFPVLLIAFAPLAARSRPSAAEVWRSFRLQVIGAGILTPLAYMLVLAALSLAAVSAVVPAREISVLFGVLLGRQLLDERGMARKLIAAAAIVAGVIAIAIG